MSAFYGGSFNQYNNVYFTFSATSCFPERRLVRTGDNVFKFSAFAFSLLVMFSGENRPQYSFFVKELWNIGHFRPRVCSWRVETGKVSRVSRARCLPRVAFHANFLVKVAHWWTSFPKLINVPCRMSDLTHLITAFLFSQCDFIPTKTFDKLEKSLRGEKIHS